jgi:hypothetical protein
MRYNAVYSVACLEWYWWILKNPGWFFDQKDHTGDETNIAKEAKKMTVPLRKTPRLYTPIGD